MGRTFSGSSRIVGQPAGNVGGQCGHRGAQPERGRGEQEVLHREVDRRGERGFVRDGCVPAHHDDDRRRTDAALRTSVDLGQQGLGQPADRLLACPRTPDASSQLGDVRPLIRIAHHHEDPGLKVLRARRVCRGEETALDQIVPDRLVGELTRRTLAEDDLEESRLAAFTGVRHLAVFTFIGFLSSLLSPVRT